MLHIPLHFDRRSIAVVSLRVEYYWHSPSSCPTRRAHSRARSGAGLSQAAARESCVPTVAVRRRPTRTTLVVEVHQPPERPPNQARRSAMHLEQGDGVARLCRPVSQLIVERQPRRPDGVAEMVVHGGWCQIAQAAVMVRVVVPREQIAADARACSIAGPKQVDKLHAGPRMTGVIPSPRRAARRACSAWARRGPHVRQLVRGDALGRWPQAGAPPGAHSRGARPSSPPLAAEEVEDDVQRGRGMGLGP